MRVWAPKIYTRNGAKAQRASRPCCMASTTCAVLRWSCAAQSSTVIEGTHDGSLDGCACTAVPVLKTDWRVSCSSKPIVEV